MQLTVKGKQIDVGDSLREYVSTELENVVQKYFSRPIEATVVFSKDAHLFKADISVHAGRGIALHADADADQPYPAVDKALAKIAKRLRRHKSKLRDHHKQQEDDFVKASQYVIEHDAESEEEVSHDEEKLIVAEMETVIETLTVGEAVMRLDLGNLPAVMFRNRGTGGLNMVYRRPDGNFGWVDPASGKKEALKEEIAS